MLLTFALAHLQRDLMILCLFLVELAFSTPFPPDASFANKIRKLELIFARAN